MAKLGDFGTILGRAAGAEFPEQLVHILSPSLRHSVCWIVSKPTHARRPENHIMKSDSPLMVKLGQNWDT